MSSEFFTHPAVARATCLIFAIIGVVAIVYSRRSLLGDERSLFANAVEGCSIDVRARIAAAIERRRAEELLDVRPAYVVAGMLIALCVLAFTGTLAATTALGLQIASFVGAMAIQLLLARRVTGTRRLASMVPRSPLNTVGPMFLVIPLFSAGLGVWFMWTHEHDWVTIATMTIAGVIAVASSIIAARTPAIVGDIDPAADELVDQKVRGSRVRQLLMIAAYAPLILAFTAIRYSEGDSMMRTLWLVSMTAVMLTSQRALKISKHDLEKMLGLA